MYKLCMFLLYPLSMYSLLCLCSLLSLLCLPPIERRDTEERVYLRMLPTAIDKLTGADNHLVFVKKEAAGQATSSVAMHC